MRAARVAVSAAFFTSEEFQQSGYFIYRLYKAAFGRRPTFDEFSTDRTQVVGGTDLETDKQLFAGDFARRPEFVQIFPRNQSADQFVNTLLIISKQATGVDLSAERVALAGLYDGTDAGRARIVRRVADDQSLFKAEYNRAFVLMQYFGYLRREPDQGGYDFWQNVLSNRDPNNFKGMVCAFLTSAEYQNRFGGLVTRTNADCGR